MFVGYYNKSIILTFIGLFCTILGLKFSFDNNYVMALVFLLLSGLCDTFDGTVASLVKRNKEEKLYGIQLDSLVDIICFGLFPIIICFNLGYNSFYNIIVYFIFLFCGVSRLAYFNVDKDNQKYFRGLPITMSSFILSLVMLITIKEIFVMISLLILSFLFIFNFKIPKSSLSIKILYLIIGLLIIGLLFTKM